MKIIMMPSEFVEMARAMAQWARAANSAGAMKEGGMKRGVMKTGLALAAALTILAPGCAFAADVGGNYSANGTNFDGSTYSGSVEISVTSNTTCRIVWHIAGADSKGICMRANDDSFVAAYKMKNAVGLVYYTIKSDGVLDGVWTIADQDGAGKEVLTPRK